MKCPRDDLRCSKYNTVRHCPGCPLWQGIKEARQRNLREPARQSAQPWQTGYPEREGQAGQSGVSVQPHAAKAAQTSFSAQRQAQPSSPPYAQTPVAYTYDGSMAGFFCCVFESVVLRELPSVILPYGQGQPMLIQTKEILSDPDKSRRVRDSIPVRISEEALDLIETVFLSCLEQKELRMLKFLLLAYREGAKVLRMLGHPDVATLLDAEKHLMKEAHLLKGFVRFSDYDGVLAAHISPKNFVLPFLANHFCERFAEEEFILYDKVHKAALLYQNHRRSIVRLEEMPFPQAAAVEERYRALWKQFYQSITIEARNNPRCRMTHMPKRYWENMTEMAEFLE